MFIIMWAGGMPFNGDTIPSGKSLGGSETAAYYVAKELAKRGHKITMFTNSRETGVWDGVVYEWHGEISDNAPLGERWHYVSQVPFDVAIVQRHPLAFQKFTNAKIRVLWMHDLALIRNMGGLHQSMPFLDYIFGVSGWHRDQIMKTYEMTSDNVIATANGVDYDMFPAPKTRAERMPMSMLYTARPERGLENLVRPGGIMELMPEAHLYVCGYDNTVPQMAGYYNYLWGHCDRLPNVTNLGPLGKKELYEWESKVMLHVYPTTFEDTSCIAAMESQAGGTPFIASQCAALPETCRGAGAILLPLNTISLSKSQGQLAVNSKLFAKTATRLLTNEKEWNDLHDTALKYRKTWGAVAEQWEKIFNDTFEKNSSNRDRLGKHLFKMSDIVAAEKAGFELPKEYDFYKNGTYAEHYKAYYEYEKNRGVNYGPESLEGNNRFEAVSTMIKRHIDKNPDVKDLTILDYGCAHGHYVMNLAKRFPMVKNWIGIDIDESNIKKAKAWAEQDKIKNAQFYQGTINDVPSILLLNNFSPNIIMANEVLEHVPDPCALVDELKSHLTPDGMFVATTPYGPWEAIGYKQHPDWRAHIHHFERQDLVDLFGNQPDFNNIAVPTQMELGSYLVTFSAGGPACGEIDYNRKLKQQSPAETLSVCMIAHNEEYQIGACLEKIIDIADEIIVGIDENTSDNTEEICRRFGARTMRIPSPTKIGFDEARNLTIAQARMDWIMWIDADERLENSNAVNYVLRNSPVLGFAINQHHLGVNPPGVQKTDLPCRLFRNRIGIKFYGCVHEHPEITMNEGVGKVIILESAAIGHYGYSTEKIRRDRFTRNFPLMKMDREKYPNRRLGKMLWIRDLAHLIRYDKEVTGTMTERAQQAARDGIDMFRELIASDDKGFGPRMVIDALPYYSECVASITDRASEVGFQVVASPFGNIKMPDHYHRGLFMTVDEARKFIQLVSDEALKVCGEKYL